ncbi:MAG: radical SAM protein [Methylococcaceae bacterium]|jgi:wyosine [tRNA(Phe)-imidazoG37] synthetase (radical SAM superfamily)|nr:radical SAM protein [Methylococcaceae bacterium]MDP3018840.1 radical SAM protein [Methylococcaceae bacterium]MDP3391401.1 radical SAM protein [Methylococcaceae bacterium]MDP3933508.1 radical SAM protein [Methylococcaceae bacterium]MDZ4155730.1 radical SAM protein [Methylococcales bacterium]
MTSKLTTTNHSREVAGLKYVYPVVSRRSGGLSIGINFNTNNACNWRCIYCQVPNLTVGAAPLMDFELLEKELRDFLDYVLNGSFYDDFQVDEGNRVIKDIAISGNGEPTSLNEFERAVALIGDIAEELGVFPESHFVLITNGSLVHRPGVQKGLKKLNEYGGEVWFKFDSATQEGRQLINHAGQSCQLSLQNLMLSAELCHTKVQTCLVDYDGGELPLSERAALLNMLKKINKNVRLKEVLLYTLARPSFQPESVKLEKLPEEILNEFADQIRQLGFTVSVSN